jgi:hypothetical protein
MSATDVSVEGAPLTRGVRVARGARGYRRRQAASPIPPKGTRSGRYPAPVLLLALTLLMACGGDGGTGPEDPFQPSPVPVLTALSPDSLHQVDGDAHLSFLGSGFVQGARVVWKGAELTPTFVNDRTLRLSLRSEDLSALGEVQVAVRNPAPGGGNSGALPLRVVPPRTCTAAGPACHERFEVNPGRFVRYYRSFEITRPNPQIRRVLIIVHGLDRNADSYFTTGILVAEARDALRETLVLAPRFQALDDNPTADEYYWATGGWARGHLSLTGGPTPRVSSYEVVDRILERLADPSVFPALDEIVVAGHSAGGQYVHRFASGSPVEHEIPRLRYRYVVANPSTFLYLGPERPDGEGGFAVPDVAACPDYNFWHRGLEERNTYMNRLTPQEIRANLAGRDLRILLGTADTGSADLDMTCAGMLQGEHRYDRGLKIMAFMDAFFPGHGHRVYQVWGVGHSNRQMFTSLTGLQAIHDP